jgi:WD40 repeat protein
MFALAGDCDSACSCAISGDGKQAVSRSDVESVNVWDLETGGNAYQTLAVDDHQTNCAVSPDGVQIVAFGPAEPIFSK